MVRTARDTAFRPKIIHSGTNIRVRCDIKFTKVDAQHFKQMQLHFGSNSEVLMELNMEIIYQRYLLSLSQGHEHMRK